MAGRILNKLAPDYEGALYESIAAAKKKLQEMLNRFKGRGYVVSETEGPDGRLYYNVSDDEGHLVGIYYIE